MAITALTKWLHVLVFIVATEMVATEMVVIEKASDHFLKRTLTPDRKPVS